MTPPPPSQEQSEALRTETKIQTQVRDPSVSCDEFVGTTPVLGLMVLTTLAQACCHPLYRSGGRHRRGGGGGQVGQRYVGLLPGAGVTVFERRRH